MDALFSAVDLASREGYKQFLAAQASAYLPAERSLEDGGIEEMLRDWSSRKRSHLILQDLEELGLTSPKEEEVTALNGVPALLGAAYVLEGSRLGGKLLLRQVPAGLPTAFLSQSLPNAWRTMVAVLDEQLTAASAIDEAIEAARDLFAVFERSGQQMTVRRNTGVA